MVETGLVKYHVLTCTDVYWLSSSPDSPQKARFDLRFDAGLEAAPAPSWSDPGGEHTARGAQTDPPNRSDPPHLRSPVARPARSPVIRRSGLGARAKRPGHGPRSRETGAGDAVPSAARSGGNTPHSGERESESTCAGAVHVLAQEGSGGVHRVFCHNQGQMLIQKSLES